MSFEKNILNKLLDKYEKSKLSRGGTSINRNIRLTTKDEVLSSYTGFDSYKHADLNDAVIHKLEKQGFITAIFENDTFKSLTLNIVNVDSLYDYLNRKNPADELREIKEVLNKYHFDNFLDMFIEYVNDYIYDRFGYL